MVLSLAVLPSIVEEFVFRGIMLREYRNGGIWFAALISSIMFAMIHFDLKQFPIYLDLGMILAWIEFITKSVWACVAVHIIYNIYAIFIEKYIWIFSTNPDSEVLFWLILVCALFICAFFFLSSAEKVMRLCVDVGERAPSVLKISARRVFMFDAVTEKPFLIACAVFAVISLINLIIK
jgi:hypothetical protein